MKRSIILLLTLIISTNIGFSQKAIFLHHSTGGAVFSEGDVEGWITNYNSTNGTSYSCTERAYPDSPYPWENYPYDFWNLWVNGGCDSEQSGIECINSLAASYNLIIFKHCFPGAGIEEDTGSPDITSDRKSLENYKLQYRALRTMMDNHPGTLFMVWTLAPLHRNATNAEQAARAREFVNWVKNTWLEEDGKSHPNIYIFDFYNIVAESDPTPAHGQVNCLMYDYEGDHDGSDSHPNYAANQVAGPQFAEAVVNCLSSISSGTTLVESIDISSTSGYYVINSNGGSLQLEATVSPEDATNKSVTWSIIDGSEFAEISTGGLLHALRNGTVRVQATANDGSGVSNYIDIPISNQPVSIESIEIRSEENTNIINTDNGTLHLYAYALPESIRYEEVTWSIVSGSDHITLSSNGLITAITDGTARVKATHNTDSGISATFEITVSNQIIPIEAIGIGTESGATTINTQGGTLQLTYNLIPGNATGYAVWSIIKGNEFAEVSNDGLLHAVRNGTVRVQAAASSNPDITNYIDITITNQPVYVEQLEIRAEEETNTINTDNGKL
ncbi:MAG TPA: Ig-like domain-containing protein, partial [Prolixibacteraceae bacterium]|nr:Ig-like domain-containing protein [Prolixibacteraceae bacterium]